MSALIPFLVGGLSTGAVYGMAGIGLVLTFKTSSVFNFAHGALATLAAYVFYVLHVQQHVNWPLAAVITVFVLGPILGLGLELIARSIQTASLAVQVATTVGLMLAIESVVQLIFGNSQLREVPVFLSHGSFMLDGTPVQWANVITLIIAIVVTLVLSVFFRLSRRGAEMRAVVGDPELLSSFGTGPTAVRRSAWMIGTMLAAASGVLFAPLLPLNPEQLTLLILAAFAAAAIGGFSNLPLTLFGGLGIGVLASFCTKWFLSGILAGVPPSVPFLVLFGVLLIFPKRYLTGQGFTPPRARPTWSGPPLFQAASAAVLVVLLAVVPIFAGVHISAWTSALGTAIVFLSLGLLVRSSGQVSLSHITFVAIGAVAFSHLAASDHVPWVASLLIAGLIAVPIGALLAIPAIRLSGLYLALATFGFGVLVEYMFYGESFMFGQSGIGLNEPAPSLSWIGLHGTHGLYYLTLFLAVLAGAVVAVINRSRLGRLTRGMADSPTVLATSGTSIQMTRVIVFCISAFMAAIGGALAGVGQGTISAGSYDPLISLEYFVLVMIISGGELWAAVLAAIAISVVPDYFNGATINTVLQLVFGVSAILFATTPEASRRMLPPLAAWIDKHLGWRRTRPAVVRAATEGARAPVSSGGLAVNGLTVRYGGLVAVGDISLRAPTAQITALIGPNGAGKTTIFNACSGLVRATSGQIEFDGRSVTRASPAIRARRGLGRSFQKMELLESLTVTDNVAIGAEAANAGVNPLSHFVGRPGSGAQRRRATAEAIALCGLTGIADKPVSALSTGQRRLVDLARCLAGDFRVLLLDEPSSGLDRAETQTFGEILRGVVAARGLGILIVEHDMSLVLDVCDQIYVLDFGRLIFEGTPDEVRHSAEVRAAYLGDIDTPLETVGSEA